MDLVSLRVLPFVWEVTRPFWRHFLGILVFSFILAIMFNLQPYFSKRVIEVVTSTGSREKILQDCLFYGSLFAATGLAITFSFRYADWFSLLVFPRQKEVILLKLSERMALQSMAFYKTHQSGNLLDKMLEVSDLTDSVRSVCNKIAICIFTFFLMLINLSFVHIFFTLGLLIWMSCFVGGSLWLLFRRQHLIQEAAEMRSCVAGRIMDLLSHMMSAIVFARRRYEVHYLRGFTTELVHKEQAQEQFFLKVHTFQGVSFVVFEVLCLVWLVKGLLSGIMTPGDFVLVLTLNQEIVTLFWDFSQEAQELYRQFGKVKQALSVINIAPTVTDAQDAGTLEIRGGEVTFDRVRFFYHDAVPLFEDKSITIPAKQKVGLVGYSGSGKSTFIHLILRLYDVTSGRILIDGQDIRYVTQESLREAISVIPQDTLLFDRSLLENIRYGRLDATDEEVKEAAKKAHIHDVIERLPEGYHSVVGSRGGKLSGGQRQLIGVARAILKNAPILILDEATSHLDLITEKKLQKSLWSLMKHKTAFVVAHRLATLQNMERILVFDRGKIVQDGPHHKLITEGGVYKKLWETHVGGILPPKAVDVSELA